MNKTAIIKLDDLPDRKPKYALVGEVDLVVVRFDDEISVTNNEVERSIRVVNEKINVLYIEGNG